VLDEALKKAFDFAADLAKQLLTLATAIITLTITFAKDFLPLAASPETKRWALYAWCAFLLSIICGVWTLMALTGTLDQRPGQTCRVSIRGANVVVPAASQIILFLAGLILTVVFARLSF
jgi:hypothetical protein